MRNVLFGFFCIFYYSLRSRCTANLLINYKFIKQIMRPQSFFSYLKSEYSCMSVKFSPFDETRVAISCCDNFGIVGKGKLLILDIVPGQSMTVLIVHEKGRLPE